MLLAACTTPDFGDSEAGLALEDMASGQKTSRLAILAPRPARASVQFITGGEERVADLYRPGEAARAAIVLVPGVVAQGRRDARVVAMAGSLVRLGFTVMVPDNPGVRHNRMRASDVREVADSVAWLADRPALAPAGHVGIAGFSYGAGPVLLAAQSDAVRDRVRFVLSVGGYYSIEHVVRFITTGAYPEAGTPRAAGHESRRVSPHPYSLATFVRSNLDLLARPRDREFFRRYAAHLLGEGADAQAQAPRSGRLEGDARAFYELIANRDPARVPGLLARLSPRIRAELEGIDPSVHDLSRLRAEVILLHGRGDNLIPYTESIELAKALPAGQSRLFIIDGLAHVDFRPKRHDVEQLLGAMQALLEMRAAR